MWLIDVLVWRASLGCGLTIDAGASVSALFFQ
jgi:hypothetical protein